MENLVPASNTWVRCCGNWLGVNLWSACKTCERFASEPINPYKEIVISPAIRQSVCLNRVPSED